MCDGGRVRRHHAVRQDARVLYLGPFEHHAFHRENARFHGAGWRSDRSLRPDRRYRRRGKLSSQHRWQRIVLVRRHAELCTHRPGIRPAAWLHGRFRRWPDREQPVGRGRDRHKRAGTVRDVACSPSAASCRAAHECFARGDPALPRNRIPEGPTIFFTLLEGAAQNSSEPRSLGEAVLGDVGLRISLCRRTASGACCLPPPTP